MRKLIGFMLCALLALPTLAAAATVDQLEKQLQELQKQIDEISASANKGELHAATDKIQFYGDLRTKADSLTYRGIQWPMATMLGMAPPEYNKNNTIVYTTRLRLNMKANVWDNVDFAGRLSMYKNWGDSTGVKMMDSFGVTMDGTNGGNTTGDFLRVERAYFNWKDIGGSDFYLSIGRRPSTYGPPTQYRENELRGGTPSGHLVNFNFDGVTLGYHLSELTGIEGQTIRFCYGQGYEAELGNGDLMYTGANLKDTHLGGFNVDVLDDGTNFVQLTLFRAQDITDGFKGLAVMPMFDTNGDGIPDSPNSYGLISRLQASANLGGLWIGGLGLSREEDNGIKYFLSLGASQSDPNGNVSLAGYGGLLSNNGDKDKKDGYSIYTGVQIPTGDIGKLGLEYNYGSRYWFNFTQAQDDMVGSKLATRGHVGEAYYIVDINPNMFIKLGGLYYDFEYTGSGAPVGLPVKVKDVMTIPTTHAALPVIDKAYDAYASLTVKF